MVNLSPFDAGDYLTDAELQTELLNNALATGNADYIASALGVIARARGMSDVEDDPRLTTLMGVAKALGLTFVTQVKV